MRDNLCMLCKKQTPLALPPHYVIKTLYCQDVAIHHHGWLFLLFMLYSFPLPSLCLSFWLWALWSKDNSFFSGKASNILWLLPEPKIVIQEYYTQDIFQEQSIDLSSEGRWVWICQALLLPSLAMLKRKHSHSKRGRDRFSSHLPRVLPLQVYAIPLVYGI